MDQTRSDSNSGGATSEAASSPLPPSVLDVGADRRDAMRAIGVAAAAFLTSQALGEGDAAANKRGNGWNEKGNARNQNIESGRKGQRQKRSQGWAGGPG